MARSVPMIARGGGAAGGSGAAAAAWAGDPAPPVVASAPALADAARKQRRAGDREQRRPDVAEGQVDDVLRLEQEQRAERREARAADEGGEVDRGRREGEGLGGAGLGG